MPKPALVASYIARKLVQCDHAGVWLPCRAEACCSCILFQGIFVHTATAHSTPARGLLQTLLQGDRHKNRTGQGLGKQVSMPFNCWWW